MFFLSFGIRENIFAQNSVPQYHIDLDAGSGPAKYFSGLEYDDLNEISPFVFTFRIMWEPEYLLRIGVESGYLPLYDMKTRFYDTVYGTTDAHLSLEAVPLVLIFSTQVYENVEVFGGVGGFVLFSEVSSFGNTVRNRSWSNAYEFGVNYLYPIAGNLKLGGELKTYYVLRLENFDLVFNVMLKYSLISY